MKRVALLFSCAEYGTALAKAIESVGGYEVDLISDIPIPKRVATVYRGNYDLLVADEPIGNGPFAVALGRLTDTPSAVVFRGWADLTNTHGEWGPLHERSIVARTHFTVREADCLFVLGGATRDQLAQRYDVERALTVGRPLDVAQYRSGTSTATEDDFTALTVTNLRHEGKFDGVKTIIDGLEPIFEAEDRFRYRVAGDGPYLSALREYVADTGCADRIDVLGWRSDVPDLLASADLFVYVSYNDAYPTAVHEAQAAGLPIIGGDAVGVPAAVGEAGLVCEASPIGVSEATRRLVYDDGRRAEFARRSTEWMDEYNARSARRYVAIRDALIEGRDPHGEDLPTVPMVGRADAPGRVAADGGRIP